MRKLAGLRNWQRRKSRDQSVTRGRPTWRRERRGQPLRIEVLEQRLLLSLVSWDGGGDGTSWSDQFNWGGDVLPGAADDVLIDLPGDITVTHGSGTTQINSLTSAESLVLSGGSLSLNSTSAINNAFTISRGTLSGSGNLTVGGLLSWSGGTLWGSGQTIAQGGLAISGGSAYKFLDGYTLVNAGLGIWTGGDTSLYDIRFKNGAVLLNQAGATFDIQTDQDFEQSTGAAGAFNNGGTLLKSAGTGTTEIEVVFNNTGTVEVQSGTLRLDAGGTSSGSFTAEASAVLAFSSGTHQLEVGSSVSAAGEVHFRGGTTDLNGAYNVTGSTKTSGGTANFNASATVSSVGSVTIGGGTANFSSGEAITTDRLSISSGTLAGSDTVTVTGLTTWSAGTLKGSGQTIAQGGLAISGGSAYKFLDGYTLVNAGPATWTAGDTSYYDITFKNGAVLTNQAGATFDIQTNQDFEQSIGAAGAFNNAGTLLKSSGTAITEIEVAFNNTGTVEVQSGTLDLNDSLVIDGQSKLISHPSTTVLVRGDLLGDTKNAVWFAPRGTLKLAGSGSAGSPQRLEVMGSNRGPDPENTDPIFGYSSLALGNGTYVQLVDFSDNVPGGGPEALYIHDLVVPAGTTFDLNGYYVYAVSMEIGGTVVNGTVDQMLGYPVIVAHTPTGALRSETVESVQLSFSQPMDPGSFSLSDDVVSFTGPEGSIDPTGHTWIDSATLEVRFEPQSSLGTYQLTTGSQIREPAGNALDQDKDFVRGEAPDDRYMASFTIIDFTTVNAGTITSDQTWSPEGGTFLVDGLVTIASGATLTIKAGTIVKFDGSSSGITVSGTLEVGGTASQPVVLSSWKDDTAGRDSNGDGDATTPAAGDWQGIKISSSGEAMLKGVEIRYASIAVDANASGAQATLENAVLRDGGFGVYVYSPFAEIQARNVLIADNSKTGVFVRADSRHVFQNCTIVGNGFGGSGWYGAGVHQGGANLTLDSCIVAFNADGLHHSGDPPRLTIRNSDFYNPAGQEVIWDGDPGEPQLDQDGNVVADPWFVGRTAGNYELAAGSPAIDSGRGIQAPPTDILGRTRYDDQGVPNVGNGIPSYVDMGAFER